MADEVALLIVGELFEQRSADALGDSADDLAVDDQRIDERSGVAHDRVLQDSYGQRFAVDLHHDDVHSAGECGPRREEVVRRFETWRHAIRQGLARGSCAGELTQADPPTGRPTNLHPAVDKLQIAWPGLEELTCQEERLVLDLARGDERRVAGHHRVAACVCAHAIGDGVRIAVGHAHGVWPDPQLVGHDLGERCRRALPVRRRPGHQRDFAARIHSQQAALVRSEAGQHDVGRQPDPQQSTLIAAGALDRLDVPPVRILRQLERTIEAAAVVATVVHDPHVLGRFGAHVPRELVGLDEVLAAHLGRVEPQLLRDAVDDALGGKDCFRLPGAAIGCRRGLVGQRDAHAALVRVEAVGSGQSRGRQ